MIAIKISFIVIGIFLAAFFAGIETGIYRMSRFNLRIGIEKKRPFFSTLGRLLDDTHGLILSMLVGTNMAQYIVTSSFTILLIGVVKNENATEIYSTLIITPILFVFSELIPKNIFIYHADRLMGPLTPVIWFFHRLFSLLGIVALLKFFAYIFSKITSSPHMAQPAIVAVERHHISQIAADTSEEGILTTTQSKIIHRLVDIPDARIAKIATPIRSANSVSVNVSKSDFFKKAKQSQHRRLLVYENNPANIIGYLDVYEVLSFKERFENIKQFTKPIQRLKYNITVSMAMKQLKKSKQRIAVVITKKNKNFGILTIKDLVEEYIGEVTDI